MSNQPKFYDMCHGDKSGVAYSSPDAGRIRIPDCGEVMSWKPLELVINPDKWPGPIADYMNSNLMIRLCSRRLKDLLEGVRSTSDIIQWLPAYVTDINGNRSEYFILHFPEPPDVLNMDAGETLYHDAGDTKILIRPCLSRTKARNRRLFNIPGLENTTIVHESVRRAIEASGMTNVEFEGIRTRD